MRWEIWRLNFINSYDVSSNYFTFKMVKFCSSILTVHIRLNVYAVLSLVSIAMCLAFVLLLYMYVQYLILWACEHLAMAICPSNEEVRLCQPLWVINQLMNQSLNELLNQASNIDQFNMRKQFNTCARNSPKIYLPSMLDPCCGPEACSYWDTYTCVASYQQLGRIYRKNFIKRNLGKCTNPKAYMSLIRPILEYATQVWDPYQKTLIH